MRKYITVFKRKNFKCDFFQFFSFKFAIFYFNEVPLNTYIFLQNEIFYYNKNANDKTLFTNNKSSRF